MPAPRNRGQLCPYIPDKNYLLARFGDAFYSGSKSESTLIRRWSPSLDGMPRSTSESCEESYGALRMEARRGRGFSKPA